MFTFRSINMWMITVFVVFLTVTSSHSNRRYEDNDWDILVFSQNWPITECITWKQKDESQECNMPDVDRWTVHGVWPTKIGTKGPEDCDPSLKFDITQIESILKDLEYSWLSVQGDKRDESFWKHEWEKHGTCATTDEKLNTELKYFSQGLEFNRNYNLVDILSKAGIEKSNSKSYNIADVSSGISSVTGTLPYIACAKDEENDRRILEEIRLCFDKDLTLTDCADKYPNPKWNDLLQDCPEDEPVFYPDQISQY